MLKLQFEFITYAYLTLVIFAGPLIVHPKMIQSFSEEVLSQWEVHWWNTNEFKTTFIIFHWVIQSHYNLWWNAQITGSEKSKREIKINTEILPKVMWYLIHGCAVLWIMAFTIFQNNISNRSTQIYNVHISNLFLSGINLNSTSVSYKCTITGF